MKLIIVFTGLIAHIASGPNWWAVAVNADHHHPQLVVSADALLGDCKKPCAVQDGVATIDLSGDHFTIEGLDASIKPDKSGDFDDKVPSLDTILGAQVDPEVEKGKDHAGVAAAIRLGKGRISASNCMLIPALWPDEQTRTCLAESIVWAGELPKGDIVTLKGQHHSWTFRSGAVLSMRNEHPGNHFATYKKLSKASKAQKSPKPVKSAICLTCKVVDVIQPEDVRTAPDLECTPTRYP